MVPMASSLAEVAQVGVSKVFSSPAARPLFTASGIFLVGEGVASMIFSQDSRLLCQVGRAMRIAIGLALVVGTLTTSEKA